MKRTAGILGLSLLAPLVAAAELKVASLHPLLTDLLKQVGGERVEVIDVIGPNGDPHQFEPGPRELQAARGAALYFVSGKGLEPYLPKLRDIVGADRVVEVGAALPTLKAEWLCDHGDHEHEHEHEHAHEVDDPHWWHSIDCWKRAAREVAVKLGTVDEEHAAGYLQRALAARAEFEKLEAWMRGELATVPKANRTLATAHAAFAYFCNEHGWRMLPVQGLNREQVAAPKFVGELAKVIREEKVLAIFPELHSNPKMLHAIAENAGVKVADPLMADGGDSIEKMFRHNVTAIVRALGPQAR
jgi:zinc/manganese transport system substrate-binding protein